MPSGPATIFPLREHHVPTTCIPFQALYSLISIPRHDRLVRSPCFLLARFDTFCFPRSAHPLVPFTSLGPLLLPPSHAFHQPAIDSRMKMCEPEALFLFSSLILFFAFTTRILSSKTKIIHFSFRFACYRSTTATSLRTNLYKVVFIHNCRFILS